MISPIDSKYFKLSVQKLKKDSPNEISTCCPSCGDTKYRLHIVYVPQGDYSYVKCFNDGCDLYEPTNMYNFLRVINSNYLSSYKRATLDTRIQDIKSENNLGSILDRVKKAEAEKTRSQSLEVPQILLDRFKKCRDDPDCYDYLKQRNIEPQDTWLFSKDKFFEFNKKKLYLQDYLIIPIFNSDNKFRGWYSRSIKEKKFSTFLLEGQPKFWTQHPKEKPEIVCEGILDACSTGFKNIAAAISADIPKEVDLSKDTIIAFDNDPTGIRKSIQYSKEGYQIFVWPDLGYKDFNEMLQDYTSEEIKELILSNTFRGIQAETRLRMKDI